MSFLQKLKEIREHTGEALTDGLSNEDLVLFADDVQLGTAIDEALVIFQDLLPEQKGVIKKSEKDLIDFLQGDYVNFYQSAAINPYVAIAARGPWIVTLYGAVLHDSGGYGMLGFGHGPDDVLDAMNKNHVMANVMTPSLMQKEFANAIRNEVGHTRSGDKRQPYAKFVCMNSGSESVTVASRISDLNAKSLTDVGQKYEKRTIKLLSLEGSFHGRTDRPAQASGSTLESYQKLASFRDRDNAWFVKPNDIQDLAETFEKAEKENVFIEIMMIEPVMGEGNPGEAVTPEFYSAARTLTAKHGALLLVDSIQAGLRARGCLSIMDYPGFSELDPPDMETYSKALNAGQYPLSVLAMNDNAARIFECGIYGNTMTTNPRALDVACAVLDQVTPELRSNIVDRGQEILERFKGLMDEFPGVVTGYKGTGLLCALDLNADGYQVVGFDCVEEYMRKKGIGVIHGGKNALRFTPHFKISSKEIDLIIDHIRSALKRGPVYK